MTRTERCACGGTIEAVEGLEAVAIRKHMGGQQHREWSDRSTETRPKTDPYPEPDVTEDVLFAGRGPMQHIAGPLPCISCQQTVNVVRYLGHVRMVHPNGSLVCPHAVWQHDEVAKAAT